MRAILLLILLGTGIYFFTGFFIIQPIGALPEGATVWYIRFDTNMPFIASADSMQLEAQGSVSLLGRGVTLSIVADKMKDKKILTLPYMETLYLMSTDGKVFEK